MGNAVGIAMPTGRVIPRETSRPLVTDEGRSRLLRRLRRHETLVRLPLGRLQLVVDEPDLDLRVGPVTSIGCGELLQRREAIAVPLAEAVRDTAVPGDRWIEAALLH
jgi:hypothetical protein